MAEKMLKWTLEAETGLLTCKHKESQIKQAFTLPDFYQTIEWKDCEAVEKQAMAYAIQQKLSDLVSGKGKKAGYSGAEIFALMRNKWDSLSVDRIWSQKSGERTSPQKKLSAMKVISQSMANAAPLLGLKVDPEAKILSDVDYQKYLEEQE